MRGLVVFPVAAAFAGCSLFVSLDGLSGPDSGTDSGAPDSSTPDVVTMDATDAGLPDANTFACPDASIVCDDFDESPLGMRWTSSMVSGATMAIDDGGSYSPPNSLLLTLPPNPNWSSRNAYLAKQFSSQPTIDCDFVVKIDATTATTMYDVRPIEIDFNASGYSYWEFWLNLAATNLSFEQNSKLNQAEAGVNNRTDTVVTPLDTSKWHRIHLFTDFKRARIDVDGVMAFDKALADPINPSSGSIKVGLGYDSEPPSWTYRIDDVICR